MRVIKNTMYVTEPKAYLALDGENIIVLRDEEETLRYPLHLIQSIVVFCYSGASPALMGKCASYNIDISFLDPNGKFYGRFVGEPKGNVLLRREQYRIADDNERSLEIAKSFITGKLFNSRWIIERVRRDHFMRIDEQKLKTASVFLAERIKDIQKCASPDELRGIEGEGASVYFGVFDEMILQQKESFAFRTRNRRPPLDPVNAMLSYMYTILANDATNALNTAGLDPYVGFLHRDRPGRRSLALDLMEEFRSVLADRFVLMLINKQIIKINDFIIHENRSVTIKDDARKLLLMNWQKRKQETITHPFTGEKMQWGMAIFVQAQLLARYIRGDIDAYPPLLWK